MIKTNVEIAKMVEDRGYDFQTVLESIDFGRTAEEEEMEITQEEINELVDAVCSSFEQEGEWNMVINDLMDLIKKLFGNDYENVIIVDTSDRTEYKAVDMTIKELKSYDINQIDVVTANEDKIYICF